MAQIKTYHEKRNKNLYGSNIFPAISSTWLFCIHFFHILMEVQILSNIVYGFSYLFSIFLVCCVSTLGLMWHNRKLFVIFFIKNKPKTCSLEMWFDRVELKSKKIVSDRKEVLISLKKIFQYRSWLTIRELYNLFNQISVLHWNFIHNLCRQLGRK